MSALAVQERPAADVAEIDGLIGWVLTAPVEEVCWRLTEIGNIRDWVKAQKEATGLRMKAVRLELVALRKVALGGLANKIAGSALLRSCSKWLATLTDEEFASLLTDIDGDRSPIALYRADKAQRDAMRDAMERSQSPSEWEERATDRRFQRGDGEFRNAATMLLREILEQGEPFTVSEAAERLADRLELDVDVRAETADGLREMVRSAIRHGERTVEVGWGILPVAFTYQRNDGVYVRVPASRANFGHLIAHEREIRDRAEATLRQADALREIVSEGYRKLGIDQLEIDLNVDPEHGSLAALLETPLAQIVDQARGDGYLSEVTS